MLGRLFQPDHNNIIILVLWVHVVAAPIVATTPGLDLVSPDDSTSLLVVASARRFIARACQEFVGLVCRALLLLNKREQYKLLSSSYQGLCLQLYSVGSRNNEHFGICVAHPTRAVAQSSALPMDAGAPSRCTNDEATWPLPRLIKEEGQNWNNTSCCNWRYGGRGSFIRRIWMRLRRQWTVWSIRVWRLEAMTTTTRCRKASPGNGRRPRWMVPRECSI